MEARSREPRKTTGSVVLRALRLLDAFQPARRSLTLSQLAKHAGLPLSTAHRLLADLCDWGALERDAEGRYTIGLRIRQLGAYAPRGTLLRELCLPTMEEVVQLTGCSCVLTILDGTDAVNIEVVPGTRSAQRVTGQRTHALLTAGGRVLAAFADAALRRDVLERPVPAATTDTVTDPRSLRTLLVDIRRDGFCVSRRQADPAFDGVAAPLIDASGETSAALALVIPTDAPDLAELARVTMAAARGASRTLSPLVGPDDSHRG